MGTENIDYDDLKRRGFLRQRQDGFFILRTRMSHGIYSKDNVERLNLIAERYGNGFVHASTRQAIEIPFIRYEDIPRVEEELKAGGIAVGTSGARLRTTTTCPGNNWCKLGLVNTFHLAERIEKELGLVCGMSLPHKFKIAISGCPNGCVRPEASEIGIHGQAEASPAGPRFGFAVYLGGCGGRTPRQGIKLDKVLNEEEVLLLIRKVVLFFKERAKPRQRLALLIEEVGKETFLREVL